MPYDWEKEAEGSGNAPRIQPGVHKVHGIKVLTGSKEREFASNSGDPQIMLVVVDESAAEGSIMFTLSEKASWTLARWLSKCGADVKQMKKDGIEPADFVKKFVHDSYLVGAACWARVEISANPKYLDITPLTEEEAKKEKAVQDAAPPPPEEVDARPAGPDDDLSADDLDLDSVPF